MSEMVDTLAKQKRKAYAGHDWDRGRGSVEFFETRGKARAWFSGEFDLPFTEVEVKRVPEFDPLTPGPVSAQEYIERGWWFECETCRRHCNQDDEGLIFVGRAVFCSERCEAADGRLILADVGMGVK